MEECPDEIGNDCGLCLQAVLMFLWIVETIGLAMMVQEFTLKLTDVRTPPGSPCASS
jgi:hypothetical protein